MTVGKVVHMDTDGAPSAPAQLVVDFGVWAAQQTGCAAGTSGTGLNPRLECVRHGLPWGDAGCPDLVRVADNARTLVTQVLAQARSVAAAVDAPEVTRWLNTAMHDVVVSRATPPHGKA